MQKKKLLLHSCCGPCSSGVIEGLLDEYDVTVYYYNPNIYPKEEFDKRASEQLKYLKIMNLPCIVGEYEDKKYYDAVKGLEGEPEGGLRCAECFKLRLLATAKYAKEHGYDVFTTTMSVSPHKDFELLNKIGKVVSDEVGVDYLWANFKKKDGYLKSIRNSQKYGLYRQNYCGCVFSLNLNTEH